MYHEEYDPADWWKQEEVPYEEAVEVVELTETEKKIAHYEERARYHWSWWKRDSDKGSLYHYKQCNIKIRKLKQAEGDKKCT